MRRVHALCATLMLLAMGSWWFTLKSPPPVPLSGEPQAAILCAAAGLLLMCAALIVGLLKSPDDRAAAGFTAFVLCGLMLGTSLPDMLYGLNAQPHEATRQTELQERFVSLTEHQPAKRRDYFVLHTLPRRVHLETMVKATERHISRPQYDALKRAALLPGQALSVRIVQGRLGWAYIEAVGPTALDAR